MEFKLDGYKLDNGDDGNESTWTIPLAPGEQVLRVVRPEKKAGGGNKGGGMGIGGMGLMAAFAECEKGFTYKVKIM